MQLAGTGSMSAHPPSITCCGQLSQWSNSSWGLYLWWLFVRQVRVRASTKTCVWVYYPYFKYALPARQIATASVSFVLADHQRTSELSWDLWLFYSTYTRNFDQDMFMITNKNFVVRYLWWIYLQCSCLFTENVAGVGFTWGLQLFNEGEWLSNNHDAVHLWPRLVI